MTGPFRYKHLPSLLRKYRKQMGLSQFEFADGIGLQGSGKTQFLSRIERGYATLPSEYFKRTAQFLNVPLNKIIDAYLADEKSKIKLFIE